MSMTSAIPPTSFWPPVIDIDLLFSPQYLKFPALPPHFPLIVLSALFYASIHTIIGPILLSQKRTGKNKSTGPKYDSIDRLISFTQSCINSSLATYLLMNFHTKFQTLLTPQERILGYHEETAKVLAVSTGYFLFHLWESWAYREVHGYFMFLHSVCAIGSVSLGFRPQALHYSPNFLIFEVPNIFLNVQRYLDTTGRKKTKVRAFNHVILLFTYGLLRVAFGTLSLVYMSKDVLATYRNPYAEVRVEEKLLMGDGKVYDVEFYGGLALLQLASLALLNAQGYYWFSGILMKGDWNKKA